ncbi:hypothetical protein O3G_MSEX007263 [Manduca sexta]|uniref:Myrosinase 1-like n=1 Tax=Manduca sexta TaxID=7130 RepID=A0A922CN89_MANSE|nr:hypothetical protein O3G_MSEX007263 [Manduca sexta]
MLTLQAVVLCAIVTTAWCFVDLSFPPGFKFGVASSAYQVEGAWNISDKSESIWDHFSHTHPERIAGAAHGDVACDSYRHWKRDIQMVHELGVHFYRFSISWPRLMPTGFPNYISEDGKQYYNKLIDGLLAKGIQPLVTMYHWDLPQRLQELGGWTNPLVTDWFLDYARTVFSLYGDRVKTWITINEPLVMCEMSYNDGSMAPGIISPEVGTYLCNKHTLLAHAKAWRLYDNEFRHKYHGEISLVNHMFWYEAVMSGEEEITELAQENSAGRYSHPIFSKEGGWPSSIVDALALNSKRQGYPKSNFPSLTKEEIELMKGTYDFYAMNHYTSRQVRKSKGGEKFGSWPINDGPDLDIKLSAHHSWARTAASWFYVNPPGIRKQLVWLRKHYGNLKFIIAENGYPSSGGKHDPDRIAYLHDNLEQILLAIQEDGVNVTAYTVWSLMDNFEWMDGYKTKFGLFEVDFNSPERKRTPRASAHYYRKVIKAHSLDVPRPHVSFLST